MVLMARIVAPVDRGAHEGVRYLEAEIERPLRRGVVDVCGWFAISDADSMTLEQIVGGGREACSDLRGAAVTHHRDGVPVRGR